jgi:hypothetical protein
MTIAPCDRTVRQALSGLPTVYEDCEAALVARKEPVQERVTLSRVDRGIALQDDVVTVRSDILGALSVWSALVVDEQAVPRPRRRHPSDLARFLLSHLDWLLSHPARTDFTEEILAVTRRAERILHRMTTPQVDLGACIHADCGSTLDFAEPTGNGRSGFGEIRCGSGHTWPPSQWLYLSRHIRRDR